MDLLEFISEIGKLKDIVRRGWIVHSIENPESVSDHCFRVAVMAMLFSKELGLDSEKCIKMALIHDLGDVYTKNIARRPKQEQQVVSTKEKDKIEREATKKILSKLPKDFRKELSDLWEEFCEQKSEESILVQDLGRVETLLQVLEYKREKRTKNDLSEFFETYDPMTKTKAGKELFDKIKKDYEEEYKKI